MIGSLCAASVQVRRILRFLGCDGKNCWSGQSRTRIRGSVHNIKTVNVSARSAFGFVGW